jgi:DMSO/TMAO reductase YedYZ molybdopterin-dependent catalytic subunit
MDMASTLPPGQKAIGSFPRFGTHFHHPPPKVPPDPVIEIGGADSEPLAFALHELGTLPRREVLADFHCVAGWSATGLRWEGVPFAAFYRDIGSCRRAWSARPPGCCPGNPQAQ